MTDGFLTVILVCGALTFLTRAGGYLILCRLSEIPPRLNVALEAVPPAVITTLFAPAVFSGDWREALTLSVAVALSFRFGPTITVLVCAAMLAGLRAFG
ncbi:AzlD domain-containing protein [Acuticoccus sp. M5D2P5]|uniref:AzlD family protein n=1 Tax=Acuticoccus kalidii TaxID=2910977 RepID=UPI001F1ACA19|nr:AzlD domain-containing protein [Acuticoccus kalidii]MCF3932151.1 AzlD domain-containing protein [Acuticoccus kalidii]